MLSPPGSVSALRRLLDLARSNPEAAQAELARLSLEEQVAFVCRAPVRARARLIELSSEPEKLVPALPEAELCYTAKALGLHDAGWLLEHASREQIVACVDLDVWGSTSPDRERIGDWLRALADAGEKPLLEGALALDSELLVLLLRARLEAWLRESEDGWEPPEGARTIDGRFYFRARSENDDLAEIELLLRLLFQEDYWTYFRLLQGVNWELESDAEEWALRWRTGRLSDLGFPTWEESMAIYGALSARALAVPPAEAAFVDVGAWHLAIALPELPAPSAAAPSLFRAMAALPDAERNAHLYAFVALANKVAVADQLPLGDAESIPRAFERAADLASRGLDHVAEQGSSDPTQVLRRTALEWLFRVGVNLTGASPPRLQEQPEVEETTQAPE